MQMNYFALFRLEPRFALGLGDLETAYRAEAGRVHPDRFAQAGAASQRWALESATTANEAYRTLKKPILRARYLLELRGVETGQDSTRSPALLMEQMEWRDSLEEARESRDIRALNDLAATVKTRASFLKDRLEKQIDKERDDIGAARSVEEWLYIDKLITDVEDARALLEA
jgi:molecular chaperone HscB